MTRLPLEAAHGLRLEADADGSWRVAWRTPDWLGPLALRVEHAGRVVETPPVAARELAGEEDLGRYRGVELAPEARGVTQWSWRRLHERVSAAPRSA